jgi:ectoine hydroxylase-related dioxygenase (phytanoyl-CoA dioxygenase family)
VNGWLKVSNILSGEELLDLRKFYDECFAEKRGWREGNFFDLLGEDDGKKMTAPQMLWPSKYGYDLFSKKFYSKALSVAKQLLGSETQFKGDHAIQKAPLQPPSACTPVHQDQAYWDANKHYEALGVWIALQDVSAHMGCMQFVSGSHVKGIYPHQPREKNPRIHGLELVDAAHLKYGTHASVKVPLNAGEATFHHCRTLHLTGHNESTDIRRAYTLSFQNDKLTRHLPDVSQQTYQWNANKHTERERRQKESGWDIREP